MQDRAMLLKYAICQYMVSYHKIGFTLCFVKYDAHLIG